MKYNPDIHHRRSIRLKNYDYSQRGLYFITICTQNRLCLFGEVKNDEMILNDAGKIIRVEWFKTEQLRPNVKCDAVVIMPNHVHGIVVIRRGTARRAPTVEQFGKPVSGSIPTIIRSFKSATTKQINRLQQSPGQKIWQRNYYEHIIRNEKSLHQLSDYIKNNPLFWKDDKYYYRQ